MYIYRFSSESGYRQETTPTTPDATVQPLGRHIANKCCKILQRLRKILCKKTGGHMLIRRDVTRDDVRNQTTTQWLRLCWTL